MRECAELCEGLPGQIPNFGEIITMSCARIVLSGKMAVNVSRSVCTCPGLKPISRSRANLSTTVNVCDSLREAGYLNKFENSNTHNCRDGRNDEG